MSQHYAPPGRGGGRGQPYPSYNNNQNQQNNMGGGGGRGRPMAWQPAQPTGMPPQQQQGAPPGVPPHMMVPQGYPQPGRGGYAPHPQGYYNPYAQPAYPPRGGWQPTYNPNMAQQQQQQPGGPRGGGRGGGGVYYPPPPQQQQQQPQQPQTQNGAQPPAVVPPEPRKKKPLVITDKDGNVIDLSSMAKKPASAAPAAPAAAAEAPAASDAGAKMREVALSKLRGEEQANEESKKEEEKAKKETEDKAKKETEEKARKESEEKEKREAEERAKREAEEKARLEAEEKARKETEERAKKEAEEKAHREAAEKAQREAEEKGKAEAEAAQKLKDVLSKPASGRIILTKEKILSFRDLPGCHDRPESLADMTIVKGPARGRGTGDRDGGGGGRRGSHRDGGSEQWSRGNAPPRRQSSQGEGNKGGGGGGVGGGGGGGGGGSWERGVAPPKPPPNNRQKGGGRGGRGGHQQPPLFDGPVAPLVKSENRWRPQQSVSTLMVAEKKVKSILNKMTKETFARLSQQMVEIPIQSYAMLTMMIENVFDKAIDEPAFGDMYADLCVKLSQSVVGMNFVHIIESDEEPPTESGDSVGVGESSHNTVYRWSNDVSTTDDQIVGPLATVDECIDIALNGEDASPVERGDMELELEKVLIRQGMFIKIMKKKSASPDEDRFYTVYFDVSDAKECGQQLSEIHLSHVEAVSDANKKNSFKRSLLNKCEEEFNKQDIYVDWKKEKKEYDETKASMTEAERAEKEEELDFRRIRIKKQMLGNVKFIGQLFKKNMLKEKIMRYCIGTLLKLEETGKNTYKDRGNADMDEEDHEAICNMFTTIGSTIDKPGSADFMKLCFDKVERLSNDKSLPSRSRFMYKDLLELRQNQWVPRRKVEKAKTLEEIRKDVEREERKQAQQSMRDNRGSFSQKGGGGRGAGYDNRGQRQSFTGSNRPRQPRQTAETDSDGFTVIGSARAAPPPPSKGPRGSVSASPKATGKTAFAALDDDSAPLKTGSEPMSEDKLKLRIKSMRADFLGDGGNVDELLLSMKEISGTPRAGLILVQTNADAMMDCKEAERQAIVKIITILSEKGKLSPDEVKGGLADPIEFIDSFALDAPRAFEFLGELLGSLLRIGTVDVKWICEQSETTKADPTTNAPPRIIGETLKALSKEIGKDAAISKFNAAEPSIASLLGGADKWNEVKAQYLG